MAKNSIRDFDNTSGNNTDIQSVDISEGCSPAGINNAIREMMADLADVNDGTVALTSPSADSMTTDTISEKTADNGVSIDGTNIKDNAVKPADASGTDTAGTALTIKGGAGTGTGAGGSIVFQTADGAASTGSSVNAHATQVAITDDGSVGVGTAAPAKNLDIHADAPTLRLTDTDTGLMVKYQVKLSLCVGQIVLVVQKLVQASKPLMAGILSWH